MTKHTLKTWSEFFQAIADHRKTFEHRLNDRNYQVGDILLLREWRQAEETYTGRELEVEIIYVLPGEQFGIKPGYVALGIKEIGMGG